MWYADAKSKFLDAYYKEFKDEIARRALITLGRKEILALIWSYVEKYIEDKIPKVYTDEKEKMFWVVRTKGLVASILKEYIACPSATFDFIHDFKEALRLKKDLVININLGKGGGRTHLQAYAKNKLISQGLEIVIPYDELKTKLTYKMIIGMSYKYTYDEKAPNISPSGYAFDMESLIMPLQTKMGLEIDGLMKLLEMLPDGITNLF
ncbi:MAG: hypothetical protein ACTSYC_04575 [Promethearchaeota archaeon]